MSDSDYSAMLEVAIAEARKGLAEGGIPIGAAIFDESGKTPGSRPQPPRTERRSFTARRDGCIP